MLLTIKENPISMIITKRDCRGLECHKACSQVKAIFKKIQVEI